jgi:hypothetical protein
MIAYLDGLHQCLNNLLPLQLYIVFFRVRGGQLPDFSTARESSLQQHHATVIEYCHYNICALDTNLKDSFVIRNYHYDYPQVRSSPKTFKHESDTVKNCKYFRNKSINKGIWYTVMIISRSNSHLAEPGVAGRTTLGGLVRISGKRGWRS